MFQEIRSIRACWEIMKLKLLRQPHVYAIQALAPMELLGATSWGEAAFHSIWILRLYYILSKSKTCAYLIFSYIICSINHQHLFGYLNWSCGEASMKWIWSLQNYIESKLLWESRTCANITTASVKRKCRHVNIILKRHNRVLSFVQCWVPGAIKPPPLTYFFLLAPNTPWQYSSTSSSVIRLPGIASQQMQQLDASPGSTFFPSLSRSVAFPNESRNYQLMPSLRSVSFVL